MDNTQEPAYPTGKFFGLTKRELFSAMALQGILANPENLTGELTYEKKAVLASINIADILLKEMEQ